MAKEIKLSQGKVAIVDDEDFDKLNQHKWCASYYKNIKGFYAARNAPQEGGGRTTEFLHRVLMGAKKGEQIDHINHNALDNRRCNLRICTASQNLMNRKSFGKTSNFKGVHWQKGAKKWRAQISVNKKTVYLGCYDNEEDAARAYDKASIERDAEYGITNESLGLIKQLELNDERS